MPAIIAAPVGVVSSCGICPDFMGTPFNNSTVAGAGIGNLPWAVSIKPKPVGMVEAKTFYVKIIESIIAPVISIIVSSPPTREGKLFRFCP